MQQPSTPSTPARKKLSLQDFQLLGKLGRGAYGQVSLVKRLATGKRFALKQIQKKLLSKQQKEYQALVERELLSKIDHPGVIKINSSFQDTRKLYFVLEYCEGGILRDFLNTYSGKLGHETIAFYVGEIVNVLQYLHSHGIVHRDLKPQNIMLSKSGHLKLIDFGTAEISGCDLVSQDFKTRIEAQKQSFRKGSHSKQEICDMQEEDIAQIQRERGRRSTFVGTSYYLSPQLLEFDISNPASDLWALGCIIYQFYFGQTPFHDLREFVVFQKIKNVQYSMPQVKTTSPIFDLNLSFIQNANLPPESRDLIQRLLVKDPLKRLGANTKDQNLNFKALKAHKFFHGSNVDTLFSGKAPQAPDAQGEAKNKQFENHNRTKQIYEKRMTQQIQSSNQQGSIAMSGMLEKKAFIVYKSIFLTLFKDGSLKLEKPEDSQGEKKKTVLLEANNPNPALLVEENKFSVMTETKKYVFRGEDASKWVVKINSVARIKK